jgi:hypothetical protein
VLPCLFLGDFRLDIPRFPLYIAGIDLVLPTILAFFDLL